jgi:hypothetical protein
MLVTELYGAQQTNSFIASRVVDNRYRLLRSLFKPLHNDSVPTPVPTDAAGGDATAQPTASQVCPPVLTISRWMYSTTQSDVKQIAKQFMKLAPGSALFDSCMILQR